MCMEVYPKDKILNIGGTFKEALPYTALQDIYIDVYVYVYIYTYFVEPMRENREDINQNLSITLHRNLATRAYRRVLNHRFKHMR